MSVEEQLTEEIFRQTRLCSHEQHLETREEIIEYYQETNGVKWRESLIDALVIQTGKSRKTVSREFQYDRKLGTERYKARATKATQAKYRTLGQSLPAFYEPPEGGYLFSFAGELRISARCFYRQFSVRIEGEDAASFARQPDFWLALDLYFGGIDENPVEGICSFGRVDISC